MLVILNEKPIFYRDDILPKTKTYSRRGMKLLPMGKNTPAVMVSFLLESAMSEIECDSVDHKLDPN